MLINIDRGHGIEQMDTDLLEDTSHVIDNDHEHTKVTEYRLDGQIVHRSVHVHLKHGLDAQPVAGAF